MAARRKLGDRDRWPAGAGPAGRAVLHIAGAAGDTRGIALVLHGGRADSYEQVSALGLSPARMLPFAHALRRRGGPQGLAVWKLRNRYRGWNGTDMSPVQDARWALNHIRREHPGVPVYLLGHSMGGRTALCVADDPQVAAVVALAPWLEGTTPAAPVAGRQVLIVHGTHDRWTSPVNSLAYARRAEGVAASVDYVALKGAGHFMLRRLRLWNALTEGFILRAFTADAGTKAGGSLKDPHPILPAAGSGLPLVL